MEPTRKIECDCEGLGSDLFRVLSTHGGQIKAKCQSCGKVWRFDGNYVGVQLADRLSSLFHLVPRSNESMLGRGKDGDDLENPVIAEARRRALAVRG